MQVFRGFHHAALAPACALTIGNFDGVHRGHQAMLALLRSEAQHRGVPATVLTFEPHPRDYFAKLAGKPEIAPARIATQRGRGLRGDPPFTGVLYASRGNTRRGVRGVSSEPSAPTPSGAPGSKPVDRAAGPVTGAVSRAVSGVAVSRAPGAAVSRTVSGSVPGAVGPVGRVVPAQAQASAVARRATRCIAAVVVWRCEEAIRNRAPDDSQEGLSQNGYGIMLLTVTCGATRHKRKRAPRGAKHQRDEGSHHSCPASSAAAPG